jgi:hypothetical protein
MHAMSEILKSEILHDPASTGLRCSQCDCEILGAMTAISVVTEYWVNKAETQPTDSFARHHFCRHCTALFNFSALSVPLTEEAKWPGYVVRAASPANAGEVMTHCSDCNGAVCIDDTMTSVTVEQWPDPYITDAIEVFSTHQFCVHCAPRFDFAALVVPHASLLTAQA